MTGITLEEIEIPGCYEGSVQRFNGWRRAIAYLIGAQVWYGMTEKTVALHSEHGPAPKRLPFCSAMVTDEVLGAQPTPAQRLGDWPCLPSEPLMIIVLLTVPGSVIRHVFAGAIAERLKEIDELIRFIDDGSFGTFDLGRFSERMQQGLRKMSAQGADSAIVGGYDPVGWWHVAGTFTA
jgi:hypothetical protein